MLKTRVGYGKKNGKLRVQTLLRCTPITQFVFVMTDGGLVMNSLICQLQ